MNDEQQNVTITCDRCKRQVEGLRGPGYTGGFYEGGVWAKYMGPGEERICDKCMFADPRYQADYGKANAEAKP